MQKKLFLGKLALAACLAGAAWGLTGKSIISGETHHAAHENHHLDPETGKVVHKRVVRQDNFLFVTLKNLDIAVKNSEFLVLFVYGDWCQFSKQHHEVFKKFATYHKNIHSKLLFGSLHIAKKEQFPYADVVSNPTIFLYHHGTLLRSFNFLRGNFKILDLRPKILVAFEPFLLNHISHRKHVLTLLGQYQRFLVFVSDRSVPMRALEKAMSAKEDLKEVTELPPLNSDRAATDAGLDDAEALDRATEVLANFMFMSDMRLDAHLKLFHLSSTAALQEFFPEHSIEPGHAYLFRKKDHSLLRMESLEVRSMTNWFDVKNWLYHHLHPRVLAFPEPAQKRILRDHNMGLFLFLHGGAPGAEGHLSANESAEQALDLVAEKYYK